MSNTVSISPLKEKFFNLFYRTMVSSDLTARWFRNVNPAVITKSRKSGKLKLEIVSHCWRYAHFLTYQLSSLANYRTDKFDLTMTVFYAESDEKVVSVLDFFGRMAIPNIKWNWQPLPESQLFRRGIGRNIAAKSTNADWIWFTDADILFHENCLDTLADLLQGRDDSLVHPRIGLGTSLLPDDHELLEAGRKDPGVLDIPIEEFRPYGGPRTKARGPHQITHGDIARTCGYCEAISYYQTPADRWMKCYEDRAFRWLIGTHGTPLDIPNVCQIRHLVKGRYEQGSWWTYVRKLVRKSQESRRTL